jgi:4-diphosphocytidyl-2-C-methyl-D-erythritol kinase
MTLGLELGADVPVFVFGHAAWGEGVGERLSAIDLPESWIVLIKPDCHVNTKEIFTSKELTRDSKSITIDEFLAGDAINDCLPVVLNSYGKVKEAFDALSIFGNCQLTGTGACVFATFFHKEDAEHAFNALLDKWDVYLSRRQVISPLYKKLEAFRFNSD